MILKFVSTSRIQGNIDIQTREKRIRAELIKGKKEEKAFTKHFYNFTKIVANNQCKKF